MTKHDGQHSSFDKLENDLMPLLDKGPPWNFC